MRSGGRLPDSFDSFASALRTIAAEDLKNEGGHLTAEVILTYTQGELSDEEHLRVAFHLALCSECTQAVLDLVNFPEVEPAVPSLQRTAEEELDDWRKIQEVI